MTVLKVTRSLNSPSKLLLFTRIMLAISIASLTYILIQSTVFNYSSSRETTAHHSYNDVMRRNGDGASSSSMKSDTQYNINRQSDDNLERNDLTSSKLTVSKNNLTRSTRINGRGNTLRKHSLFHRIKGPKEIFSVNDAIEVSYYVDNCGLNHDCPRDHFSLHLFTGFQNEIYPKLCIDGKYVLDKGVNGAARGINVAIIDSISKAIISVSNFDTYDKDSTALETLLLTVRDGDIVIALTFDEPSSKLSHVARLLLAELGSGKAQNINYRTSWYMVSQKGITGYTPYEEIHLPSLPVSSFAPPPPPSASLSPSLALASNTLASHATSPSSSPPSPSSSSGGSSLPKSAWGLPHDVKTCLPLSFDGVSIQADDTIRENSERNKFCRLFAHIWPLFCESHIINDPLVPSSVMRLAVSVDIFKTPIIIMTPSQSIHLLNDLTLTLETLLRQPGIEARNVIVFYNSTCCEPVKHLVNLFGFMSAEYTTDRLPLSDVKLNQISTVNSLNSQCNLFNLTKCTRSAQNRRKNGHRSKYQRLSHHDTLYQVNHINSIKSDVNNAINSSPVNLFKDCLETVEILFPEAEQFILIESHLILSPDFLSYFGQMLPLLRSNFINNSPDVTGNRIVAISAWNENGFTTSSSDTSTAYVARIENYRPRLAMMIPRIKNFDTITFPSSLTWSFDEETPNQFTRECHRNKFIYNHTVDCNSRHAGHIIFPDVSRVSLISPEASRATDHHHNDHLPQSLLTVARFMQRYMTSPRSINLNEDVKLSNIDIFNSIESYELMIRTLIDQSSASFTNDIVSAIDWIENVQKVSDSKCKSGKNVCIVTVSVSNNISYNNFCRHFNLINCKEHLTVKSIGDILRFTVPHNIHVILIDQKSIQV